MRINECAVVLNRLSNYDVHKQSFVAWFSKDTLYMKMLQNSMCEITKVLKYCRRQRIDGKIKIEKI